VTREEFLTAAEIAFERLLTPTRGLRPALLEEPMRPGGWSLKDLAAHLAAWNSLCIRALEEINQGRSFDWTPYNDFDAHNRAAVERRHAQPLKHVLSELRITHSTLMEAVRRVPDDRLYDHGAIPVWLGEIVLDHYAHHTPSVEAWAARLKAEGKAGPTDLPVIQD
jgi:hypothetical protein